eukprot:158793-Chlamydomonas_euryale.AAC.3
MPGTEIVLQMVENSTYLPWATVAHGCQLRHAAERSSQIKPVRAMTAAWTPALAARHAGIRRFCLLPVSLT